MPDFNTSCVSKRKSAGYHARDRRPVPDGQIAHERHAKFARRVNLSHGDGIAEHPKSAPCFRLSRAHKRGVSRSSRTLGAGCDGRVGDARRAALMRTAKLCGPDAPMLASSLRVNNPQATVAKEPGHRGERRISRRTIAQGRPDCFGEPVVTTLVRFFVCVRGCGCNEHPAFPAPSLFLGERSCKARAHRAARRRRRVWNRLGCLKIRSVTIRCVRARRTSNCHHP